MDEHTKRARAAWGYSGMERDELAKQLAISKATLGNYLGRTRTGPPLDVLYKIADACAVPRAFMDAGFASPVAVAAHELAGDVNELREAVGMLSLAVLRNTQELEAMRGTGRQSAVEAGDQ